jgi:hypothetical protein
MTRRSGRLARLAVSAGLLAGAGGCYTHGPDWAYPPPLTENDPTRPPSAAGPRAVTLQGPASCGQADATAPAGAGPCLVVEDQRTGRRFRVANAAEIAPDLYARRARSNGLWVTVRGTVADDVSDLVRAERIDRVVVEGPAKPAEATTTKPAPTKPAESPKAAEPARSPEPAKPTQPTQPSAPAEPARPAAGFVSVEGASVCVRDDRGEGEEPMLGVLDAEGRLFAAPDAAAKAPEAFANRFRKLGQRVRLTGRPERKGALTLLRDATVEVTAKPKLPDPAKPAKTETPSKPEAPKPEAPKPEALKPEAPKPEAPKPEAPKPEAPKPEAPKPDAKPEKPSSAATVTPPSVAARPQPPVPPPASVVAPAPEPVRAQPTPAPTVTPTVAASVAPSQPLSQPPPSPVPSAPAGIPGEWLRLEGELVCARCRLGESAECLPAVRRGPETFLLVGEAVPAGLREAARTGGRRVSVVGRAEPGSSRPSVRVVSVKLLGE